MGHNTSIVVPPKQFQHFLQPQNWDIENVSMCIAVQSFYDLFQPSVFIMPSLSSFANQTYEPKVLNVKAKKSDLLFQWNYTLESILSQRLCEIQTYHAMFQKKIKLLFSQNGKLHMSRRKTWYVKGYVKDKNNVFKEFQAASSE